jgi:hypothetical protein
MDKSEMSGVKGMNDDGGQTGVISGDETNVLGRSFFLTT